MKRLTLVGGLVAVIMSALFTPALWAQGFIWVDPIDRPPHVRPIRPGVQPVQMVLRNVKVETTIDQQAVQTTVDQLFLNPHSFDVQGTYLFPLPNNASVSDLSMWVDGKEQKGELLDVERARQIYEDYVRRAIDPALLEYVGTQTFRLRIFPIPPGTERRIKLTYTELLPQSGGICTYRFPLNGGRHSARPIEDVTMSINIRSKSSIKTVYSPTHTVDVARKDDRNVRVGMETRNLASEKDFLLYYTSTASEMGMDVVTFHQQYEDGYFMLMISPGEVKAKTVPKDIVFVADTSGSMAENDKIGQMRKSLEYCINRLNDGDRFNIIGFATEAREFESKLIEVNKGAKERAVEWVRAMKAAGGTNINEALLKALDMQPKDGGRPYQVIFMTDGQPTIDVTDPQQILKNVSTKNQGKVRLFTFGVGYDVNTHLLDKLAEENRGAREYITPEEDIEAKVGGFYGKVADPVMTDVKLDYGRVKVYDLYPKLPADIFSGSQVVVFGRYEGDGHSLVKLKGLAGGAERVVESEIDFKKEERAGEFIPRLWAVSKIGYLLDDMRLHGENKEVKEEVVKLAKRFGIITPYTSYLVQEDLRTIGRPMPPPGEPRPMMQRFMDSDRGFGGGGEGGRFRAEAEEKAKDDLAAKSGAGGVAASKELREMQNAKPETASGAPLDDGRAVAGDKAQENIEVFRKINAAIKRIGEKTFYLVDGKWHDSEFKEGSKTTIVKFASDEYFKLVKEHPAIGRYLALGNSVIVLFEGTTYEIVPDEASGK